jgi:formylglycine-generating enzyme required for sulfatase activity
MSSLADLPELVGFFSYSREDDEDSYGALSALRDRIQRELRAQLGRSMRTFRLWQDKEAIAAGKVWESEIKAAVSQSVFFIPIITPTVVGSQYCRFELEAFLAREAALGRDDLVFPILYIRVLALEDSAHLQKDPVLSIIAKRQYVDRREFRLRDVNSTEVKEAVERLCANICDALRRPSLSPEEGKAQEEAAALQQAEAERKLQEAEAQGRKQEVLQHKAVQGRERAGEERRKCETEAGQHIAESERWRAGNEPPKEAEAKHRGETEECRPVRRSEARAPWPPSRSVLVVASLIGLVVFGAIGVWLVAPPMPVTPPTPVTPGPTPTSPGPTPATPAPTPTTQPANAPLSPERARSLKPRDVFNECTNCPEMIVVPAGRFTMGSPANELGHGSQEGPQHWVTFAQQFAVGEFALTFEEWEACIVDGGCNGYRPPDRGWGRGRLPVINVSWDDVRSYVAWLSKKTGKTYRLLSEAEREYVTRAGTTTAYWWGDEIGKGNANCNGCGSQWDNKQTAPVGSFAANAFGLYDMHGNVGEWTQDCWQDNYNGAPADGSARTSGDCSRRGVRGGSWYVAPVYLRSAYRGKTTTNDRNGTLGFRVSRTLLAP